MKLEQLVVGSFQENTYIISDEETKKALIVDPGGENIRVYAYLHQHGLTVDSIINTHGHIDHIAGVAEIQEKFNVPFKIHEADVYMVQQANEMAELFGVKFMATPRIDEYLKDGDVIKLGKHEIKVMHTPGHSPGGVCFIAGGDVIAGDTLFAGSIGRTDLPGGNYDQLIASIKEKILVMDDRCRVFCGHGPSTTVGQEKKMNPFLR